MVSIEGLDSCWVRERESSSECDEDESGYVDIPDVANGGHGQSFHHKTIWTMCLEEWSGAWF